MGEQDEPTGHCLTRTCP